MCFHIVLYVCVSIFDILFYWKFIYAVYKIICLTFSR